MKEKTIYSFRRYLRAKRTVDDRALNREVWEALSSAVPVATREAPLRALEVGAGSGAMLQRMLDWGLLDYSEYTGVDLSEENVAAGREALAAWGEEKGHRVEREGGEGLRFTWRGGRAEARMVCADAFAFLSGDEEGQWDLLVAHAFLDLVDVPTALPRLLGSLRPGGLFYFTINYDGETAFEPEIDQEFESLLMRAYHQTMDGRVVDGKPSGDSRTGRHLFAQLRAAGAEILAAGGSDWVVYAGEEGYAADEAYFLHYIIHTVAEALAEHAEVDQAMLANWVTERQAQIEMGELTYVAHNLDFVGRRR